MRNARRLEATARVQLWRQGQVNVGRVMGHGFRRTGNCQECPSLAPIQVSHVGLESRRFKFQADGEEHGRGRVSQALFHCVGCVFSAHLAPFTHQNRDGVSAILKIRTPVPYCNLFYFTYYGHLPVSSMCGRPAAAWIFYVAASPKAGSHTILLHGTAAGTCTPPRVARPWRFSGEKTWATMIRQALSSPLWILAPLPIARNPVAARDSLVLGRED